MNQSTFIREPKFFHWGQQVTTPIGLGSIQGQDGNGGWLVCILIKTMPPEHRERHQGDFFYTILPERDIEPK